MLISMTVILSSCQKSDNLFLVSGYSAENKTDVMLCSLNDKGSAEMISGFTVGDNPSYFAFGKNNLVYFANEVDSFNLSPGGGITTLRLNEERKQFVRESSVNQGGGRSMPYYSFRRRQISYNCQLRQRVSIGCETQPRRHTRTGYRCYLLR